MELETSLDGNISQNVGGFGFERPNRGKTNDWLTPIAFVHRLARLTSTHVGAWVCRGAPQRPPNFLPEHDGLTEPWFGRVWCNPPYGQGVEERWLKRMEKHGNGMLLIFGRTETQAWQKSVFPMPMRSYSLRDECASACRMEKW